VIDFQKLAETAEYHIKRGDNMSMDPTVVRQMAVRLIERDEKVAEPAQEAVAFLCEWEGWQQYHDKTDPLPEQWDDAPLKVTPLYTTPQPTPLVRLTEDELGDLFGEDEYKDCWRVVKNEDGTVKGVAFNQEWQHKFYVRCMDAMQAKALAISILETTTQPDSVNERLLSAAEKYFTGYCQDEASDFGVEDTGCTDDQHKDAAELRDAIAAAKAARGG
jgi:hypothetical protein